MTVRTDDIEHGLVVPGARRRVEAQVDIEAPIAVVWRVMTEVERYGEWNPFVVGIRAPGGLVVGERMVLNVRMGRMPARVGEHIEHVDPPDAEGRARLVYRLVGVGPLLGAIRARRIQRLEALDERTTRYASIELFGGWMSAFVPVGAVERGTRAHADALAQRSLSLAANVAAHAQ